MNEWTEAKKDWVYQRKKTLFLKSWTPRFMVLYSRPVAAIALYEQRSDSFPPYTPAFHIELTASVSVQPLRKSSASAQNAKDALPRSESTMLPSNVDTHRTSITSLVADARLLKSKKNAEEHAIVILRPAPNNHQSEIKVQAATVII
mgnify:CR=1 FL=1